MICRAGLLRAEGRHDVVNEKDAGGVHARHERDAHLAIVVLRVEELVPTLGSECHDVDDAKPNADGGRVRVEGLEADPGGLAHDHFWKIDPRARRFPAKGETTIIQRAVQQVPLSRRYMIMFE